MQSKPAKLSLEEKKMKHQLQEKVNQERDKRPSMVEVLCSNQRLDSMTASFSFWISTVCIPVSFKSITFALPLLTVDLLRTSMGVNAKEKW
jgi:hypothetical protein